MFFSLKLTSVIVCVLLDVLCFMVSGVNLCERRLPYSKGSLYFATLELEYCFCQMTSEDPLGYGHTAVCHKDY